MAGLKSALENHPIPVLAGVCVVVAGCAAGVVGWFWEKSAALQATGFEQNLSAVTTKHNEEVADLKQRLISIERRVGGDTLHVDVSKFPISSTEVPSLPASYDRLAGGRYFVSPPKFSIWTQQPASQVDLAVSILGDTVKDMGNLPGGLGAVLSEKTAILWQGSEVTTISLPQSSLLRISGLGELQLKPFVFVMPFDEELIRRIAKATGALLSSIEGDSAEAKLETAKVIELLAKENAGAAGDSPSIEQASQEQSNPSTEIDELVNGLAGMSRSDLAGYVLSDLMVSSFQMALITGAKYKLIAADKKGNVFYMRTQMFFPEGAEENNQGAYLDQEFFFVGTPTGGLLVRIGVPSRDLRSEEYAWTQAWLASLRVSID